MPRAGTYVADQCSDVCQAQPRIDLKTILPHCFFLFFFYLTYEFDVLVISKYLLLCKS